PLSDRFNDALVYAHNLHRLQPRKGRDIPYIGHLLGVASLVLENGGDEDMAIAALLHDAVEDQGGLPRRDEIANKYGERVAEIVMGCTDSDAVDPDHKLPWCDRKVAYIAHVRNEADGAVRLVSLADKVHNARAILTDHHESGDPCFDRFSGRKDGTLWYYRSLVEAFAHAESRENPGWPTLAGVARVGNTNMELAHGRRRLMAELERVVTELEARCGGKGKNPCRG
ncbi:MAG: HD domain-containing protein, partial [Terriglobales bacterium]